MAIQLEERYKGVRSPHKIKGGVSGCVRECAEAQSKDFGLIATDKGWNGMYTYLHFILPLNYLFISFPLRFYVTYSLVTAQSTSVVMEVQTLVTLRC